MCSRWREQQVQRSWGRTESGEFETQKEIQCDWSESLVEDGSGEVAKDQNVGEQETESSWNFILIAVGYWGPWASVSLHVNGDKKGTHLCTCEDWDG